MTRAALAVAALLLLLLVPGLTAAGATTLPVQGGVAEQHSELVDCSTSCASAGAGRGSAPR